MTNKEKYKQIHSHYYNAKKLNYKTIILITIVNK